MTIPLLAYAPSTQNARVEGYDAAGDERAFIFSTENVLSDTDLDVLIEAAYRQIFFHAFRSDREPFLESQLRNGQLTVRDFIRGLLLSDTYLGAFYSMNSNYRFVEQCIQRVLGRDAYNEREKHAWSIVVATKGVAGFVDELLDSEEYLDNFGFDTVPYQRRRTLASRDAGETPFNIKSPRYDSYYRAQLSFPKPGSWRNAVSSFRPGQGAPTAGNPRLSMYMDMARSAKIPNVVVSVSTDNINMSAVPYRRN